MLENLFSVKDKVCLVTGGSRGIGEMITTGLIEGGAKVYITARKVEQLEETAERLGERCIPVQADLSTEEGINTLAGVVREHEDRLDVLVNNAGASWGAPIEEYPRSGFEKVITLNVTSVFYMTQALLDLLRASGSQDDPARVINIGSVDGFSTPDMETFAYSASKAGVHHMSRHMAKYLAKDWITVNAIAPGFFPSKMTAFIAEDDEMSAFVRETTPLKRMGTPEDIAGTVIWLASRAGAFVDGAVIAVDGGIRTTR